MARGIICLVLAIGVLLPFQSQATHIVGGELNYRCLGDNNYEISLTVFRDCFNGNPAAYFDDPASVGFFDINNDLVTSVGTGGQILIDLMEDDTLDPVLFDSCLVIPPEVCVHTTTYVQTVNLPPIPGGYQLVYQRCCRNQTIVNIVDPLGTGATYYNYISEFALQECNSSAVFKEWPPNYICANEPIFFDHSAIDEDGDSLVYVLCTPFDGATPDQPQPQPPFNPPYDSITWVDPPYSLTDMMGGTPLSIDPVTGLLTGTPNTVGQFVVGVCVEEYRDGVLISTSKRDFQYNVGICGEVISSIFAPNVFCDGLTVNFENESENTVDFIWDFGDPTTTADISTQMSPTYTYPDTGMYTITLIAGPLEECSDTSYHQLHILPPSLTVDFEYTLGFCSDTVVLELVDLSTDTLSTPVSWEWTLSNGDTATGETAEIVIDDAGTYVIELQVTSENGCSFSTTQTFNVQVVEHNIPDTIGICAGDPPVFLNPGGDPNYIYEWSPAGGLNNPTSPNPQATVAATTTYSVMIESNDGICAFEKEVTVFVPDPVQVSLEPDLVICEEEYLIEANFSSNVEDIVWALDPGFFNTLAFDQTSYLAEVPAGTFTTIYVQGTDEFGCSEFDQLTITSDAIVLELADTLGACSGEPVELNPTGNPTYTYTWSPSGGLDDPNSPNPTATISGTTVYTVDIQSFGAFCSESQEVVVIIPPEVSVDLPDTEVLCDAETWVVPQTENITNFVWSLEPDFTPVISTQDSVLVDLTGGPVTVYLQGADDFGCSAVDQIELSSSGIFQSFIDTIVVCAGEEVFINPDGNPEYNYTWTPSDGLDDINSPNPQGVVTETTTYFVHVESADGVCERDEKVTLWVPDPVEVNLPPDFTGCEETYLIQPGWVNAFEYTWATDPGFTDIVSTDSEYLADITSPITLYVRGEDKYGCQAFDQITLDSDFADVEITGLTTECLDGTAFEWELNAINNNVDNVLTYEWSPPELILNGQGTDQVIAEATGTDEITLVVENQFGCTDTATYIIEPVEVSLPSLVLEGTPDSIYPGDIVDLNMFIEDGVTYEWGGGEVDDPSATSTTAQPLETTTYTVTVTDDRGCTSTAEVTIYLKMFLCEEPFLFIPNAFTPDGDGMNDIFRIRGNSITDVYLIVYNRWGEKVFETRDLETGWDGTFRGKQLPPDVFGYYLEIVCFGGEEFRKKGNVTLIR